MFSGSQEVCVRERNIFMQVHFFNRFEEGWKCWLFWLATVPGMHFTGRKVQEKWWMQMMIKKISLNMTLLFIFSSLVSGDVEGKLTQLYNRINNIQKKAGQFDVSFYRWKKGGTCSRNLKIWVLYIHSTFPLFPGGHIIILFFVKLGLNWCSVPIWIYINYSNCFLNR